MVTVDQTWVNAVFERIDLAQAPFDQLNNFRNMFESSQWPSNQQLNRYVEGILNPSSAAPIHFVMQEQKLLADGLHYEERIASQGAVATRPQSWHDLFNALMWATYPQLKMILNQLQVADLGRAENGNRTRRQQSLAHVDEAGLLVAADDPDLLLAIDQHDWQTLFIDRRSDWGARIVVHVFGHALFELARKPHLTLAGKALLFLVPQGFCCKAFSQRAAALDKAAASAIGNGQLAQDPKDMPSLPLAGIPGWREGNEDPLFIQRAACFRPRPEGRVYSSAVVISM